MKQPLKEGLQAIIDQKKARFHMPGHKGRGDFLLPLAWDFTETPETDDLHQPEGIINESQKEAARLFGAKESFYLVNGASGGLQAALLAACRPGDGIVIPRNAHQSIHFGVEFAGGEPIYLMPKEVSDGIYAGLDFHAFKKTVDREQPRAAVFVYPTYEGICWDIQPFLDECKTRGIATIIDEAHGAHLPFFKGLPPSALSLGADLVVQSVHKTLPAPTQTAILHRGTDRVPSEAVGQALHRTQTSSPSYLLMVGIEEALAWMDGRETDRDLQGVLSYRDRIRAVGGIDLFECKGQDPYKILIRANLRGLTGSALASELRARGVEPEWQQEDWVLLMGAPYQAEDDWERLVMSLMDLPTARPVPYESVFAGKLDLPERVYTSLEAQKLQRETIPVEASAGRVAAETVTPYPPGIPLVMAGERISQEIVAVLLRIAKENRTIYGGNRKISVVAE